MCERSPSLLVEKATYNDPNELYVPFRHMTVLDLLKAYRLAIGP